jgi:hypothetical protein
VLKGVNGRSARSRDNYASGHRSLATYMKLSLQVDHFAYPGIWVLASVVLPEMLYESWNLPLITMASVRQIIQTILLFIVLWLLSKISRILLRVSKTTPLKGPKNKSWIFGNSHFQLSAHEDAALMYEEWAEQYGVVYRTATALGGTKIILCDPKAIQHFYSKETYGYFRKPAVRIQINNMVSSFVLAKRN